METKGKGKAIIGIAMAAIMLASVFVAMAPISARDDSNGDILRKDVVYRGEKDLDVSDLGTTSFTLSGMADTTADGQLITVNIPSDFDVSTSYKLGPYNITGREGTTADLYIEEPEIDIDVLLNSDSIVDGSVPEGQSITIRASPNFGAVMRSASDGNLSQIKIKLTDPDGVPQAAILKTADSTEIDHPWETTDKKTGTWKVKISTDKDSCNQVDISSPTVEFTIRSEELTIEAVDDEVGKSEDIILKVTGNPTKYYYLAIEDVKRQTTDVKTEPVIDINAADVVSVGPGEGANCSAWIKTGSDGVADITIETDNADERTYTMHVYYKFQATWPDTGLDYFPTPDAIDALDKPDGFDEAEVDVEVMEGEVTFDMDTKVIIGEKIAIKGTVSAGDKVDILIEGEYNDDVERKGNQINVDEDNEFEADWDTEKYMAGSYTIKVYIDCEGAPDGDLPEKLDDEEEGSITVRLIAPGLDAEQARNVVAEDDNYELTGTATGVDDVDCVLIGPEGSREGEVNDIKGGLLIDSISVKDGEFSEDDISMVDGLDTGQWIALVLFPGRDATYGDLLDTNGNEVGAGNLEDGFGNGDYQVSLEGKNQEQIVSIITDHTVDVAGSDDDLLPFTFKVESGYVDVNPVKAVAAGDPLNISGVTNREPGTTITISTFSKPAGALDLPAVMVDVEWTTADEGTYTATIDTTDAVEGTYTLEVDDGDGNTDTVTVVIGAAAPEPTPTAEPTAEPTATAIPTPAVTAEPTAEPTATPEDPGFEAAFAIAGLLSIAYLVLRRRK